jgi:subtilase family serine protease
VSYLFKNPDAPYSASISYQASQLCAEDQIADLDIHFAKLALKGVSVMAASGDSGTQPVAGCNTSACVLQTLWPASSPWVTAVGGTMLANGTSGVGNEAAWSCSGGCFSKQDRKIAPWQERAVSEYLAQLPSLSGHPPESTFNAAGRGVPDVAAFAVNVEDCMVAGTCSVDTQNGTSFACPIFAGIASLLNEARLQANLPPMGFLNPFLYQNADAFTDIVDGNNQCFSNLYGFPATKGWDAATGLGTPNFEKLRAAALAQFTSRKTLKSTVFPFKIFNIVYTDYENSTCDTTDPKNMINKTFDQEACSDLSPPLDASEKFLCSGDKKTIVRLSYDSKGCKGGISQQSFHESGKCEVEENADGEYLKSVFICQDA